MNNLFLAILSVLVISTYPEMAFASDLSTNVNSIQVPVSEEEKEETLVKIMAVPARNKLEKTTCSELELNDETGTYSASFAASNLLFHLRKKNPQFLAYKGILRDVCGTNKNLDVQFDPSTQELKKLSYSKIQPARSRSRN